MVADPPGAQLSSAPDRGIGTGQEPDLAEPEPMGRKEERQQRPGHAVVEVVHHPRLAGAGHRAVAKAHVEHELAHQLRRRRPRRFELDVSSGLAG